MKSNLAHLLNSILCNTRSHAAISAAVLTLAALLGACDLFIPMPDAAAVAKIDQAVWEAKAPRLSVSMNVPPAEGVSSPVSGPMNPQPKLRVPFRVSLAPAASYKFIRWQALDEKGQDLGDIVVFSNPESTETSVEILAEKPIQIRPLMDKRPTVVATNLPSNIDDRIFINSTVKIRFSKPMRRDEFDPDKGNPLGNGLIKITGVRQYAVGLQEPEPLNSYFTIASDTFLTEGDTLLQIEVDLSKVDTSGAADEAARTALYMAYLSPIQFYNITLTLSGDIHARDYDTEIGEDLILSYGVSDKADTEPPEITELKFAVKKNGLESGNVLDPSFANTFFKDAAEKPYVVKENEFVVYFAIDAWDAQVIKSIKVREGNNVSGKEEVVYRYGSSQLAEGPLSLVAKAGHAALGNSSPLIYAYTMETTERETDIPLRISLSDGIRYCEEKTIEVNVDPNIPAFGPFTAKYVSDPGTARETGAGTLTYSFSLTSGGDSGYKIKYTLENLTDSTPPNQVNVESTGSPRELTFGNLPAIKRYRLTIQAENGVGLESEPSVLVATSHPGLDDELPGENQAMRIDLINTEADLAALATGINGATIDSENRIYLLMDNLDLSDSAYTPWTPIGDTGFRSFNKSFKGTFHGNNKTISGLTLRNPNPTTGLFGVAGFDGGLPGNINKRAYIRNLTVELVSSHPDLTASGSTNRGIGVVVGASDLLDFTNVTVSAASGAVLKVIGNPSGGETFVGGLAGDLDGAGDSRTWVINCTAAVDIMVALTSAGTVKAGGFAGRVWDTIFSGSSAEGDVTISGAGDAHGGGFVGFLSEFEISETTPYKLYAAGNVTVSGNGNLWAGGLAGRISGANSTSQLSTINNIYTSGNVKIMPDGGSFKTYRAGGFAGEIVNYTKVDDSRAEGTVTVGSSITQRAGGTTTSSNNFDAAGGFAGTISYNSTYTYKKLGAMGNVTAYHAQNAPKAVGGLVGRLVSGAHIQSSYSTGDVFMDSTSNARCTAGGLVGVQEYGNISASYSKGAVENINSGNDAYAGGITGWLRYGGQSIEDCYSLGDITAKYSADGGLWVMAAGILGTTSGNTANIKIWHCYAAGTVQVINSGTGPIISGGIAGQLYSSQISGTSNLDNNVYLGPSVIGRGSGGKHIHFLYALREDPPTNTNTYRGWRLSTATKQYSASATGGLTGDISIVDLDGTSRTAAQINTAWSGWGYTTTTWSTSNFNTIGTGSNERKAPKLYWE